MRLIKIMQLIPNGCIVETRGNGQNATHGKDGKFTGSTPAGGVLNAIKLDDIEIGRSLSAKAKNYDVLDLKTGEIFSFVEGTKIQNVEVFAGKGVKTPYRAAEKFAKRYGGKAEDWQHVKGIGTLDFYGEGRKAEVHWSQCAGIGKKEFFLKEWKD